MKNTHVGFIVATLLLSVSYSAQAKNNVINNDAESRAKYEKQKDNITYASSYINKENKKQKLLISEPKKDDALNVKIKNKQAK
ncbi:hypothetical protein OFO16_08375 [Vibrio natriegens]|uniref:hypothetical protein n=1 Tax=Vibrio natriegens TaxID=691 RepID=UPI0021E888E9|nr:hypothetical protein [Vibrio natriegens]UYI45884.1 hypothetical protein OFO16_08375 [Vibrio natriegens]